VFVYFGAVNYFSRVYLNGEKLGEHEADSPRLTSRPLAQLKDGENFLVIEVNNVRRADAVPTLRYDWWNYGGITRDALLVESPAGVRAELCRAVGQGSREEISAWVQLNGAPTKQVTIEIPEAGVTTECDGRRFRPRQLSFRREAGFMGAGASQTV